MNRNPTRIQFIDFGRAVCNTDEAIGREWLVTNGIGGYASGTISGIRTRRYHAGLVAATDPPSVRTLLLGEVVPTATYRGVRYPLSSNVWADSTMDPRGHLWLQRFHLDMSVPVWRWSLCDALLERRVFMVHGENTVVNHWTLLQATSPLQLDLGVLVDCRSHHALGAAGTPTPLLERDPRGIRLSWQGTPDSAPTQLHVQCDRSVPKPTGSWWTNFLLKEEQDRGYDCIDALWHAANFEVVLAPGTSTAFTASTVAQPSTPPDEQLERELARQRALLVAADTTIDTPVVAQLVLAADQFVVARKRRDGSAGLSIIAGYPWFADWARDTMISLPGLLLSTGRVKDAQLVLSTWADWVTDGLLPNRFPDRVDSQLEFNSADAPLLMIIATAQAFAAGSDLPWLRGIFPMLKSIVDAYRAGTHHGIGVDPRDGLVRASEAGLQLTWMDAKVGSHVVTPRGGKPIEINAFWFQALTEMASMASKLGQTGDDFSKDALRCKQSFARFWNQNQSCCLDVIDAPQGDDSSVRPNQLFAARLGDALLPMGQCASIVERCMSELWTPQGVRTLSPSDREYKGAYQGNTQARDGAYHQGTAWPWLFGPLMHAHLRTHGDPRLVGDYLIPFGNHLREAGLGSVSEVFSGDSPHQPGGCPAQAWSVASLMDLVVIARKWAAKTAGEVAET